MYSSLATLSAILGTLGASGTTAPDTSLAACTGNIGSMTMNATFEGTIRRDRSCWDAKNKFWWQEITFTVERDTTVWVFFAASDDAHVVVVDGNFRPVRVGTVAHEETGRRFGSMAMRLDRGEYRLQIQAARLGTRYTARPHYGTHQTSGIGLCDKSSAPRLTSEPQFAIKLAEVPSGVSLACIDPDGHPAVIRRLTLDAPADVAIELRSDKRDVASAIHVSGPGRADTDYLTAGSPEAGEPARLTLSLDRGTYYVVLAADDDETSVSGAIRITQSTTTAPFPTDRHPGCSDPAKFPVLEVGRATAGRITPDGSCGLPKTEHWPGGAVEVYRLSVATGGAYEIAVESPSFAPAVVVLRPDGGAVQHPNAEGLRGFRVPMTLDAGDYLVAVGHANPTELGSFRVSVQVR